MKKGEKGNINLPYSYMHVPVNRLNTCTCDSLTLMGLL